MTPCSARGICFAFFCLYGVYTLDGLTDSTLRERGRKRVPRSTSSVSSSRNNVTDPKKTAHDKKNSSRGRQGQQAETPYFLPSPRVASLALVVYRSHEHAEATSAGTASQNQSAYLFLHCVCWLCGVYRLLVVLVLVLDVCSASISGSCLGVCWFVVLVLEALLALTRTRTRTRARACSLRCAAVPVYSSMYVHCTGMYVLFLSWFLLTTRFEHIHTRTFCLFTFSHHIISCTYGYCFYLFGALHQNHLQQQQSAGHGR